MSYTAAAVWTGIWLPSPAESTTNQIVVTDILLFLFLKFIDISRPVIPPHTHTSMKYFAASADTNCGKSEIPDE